MKISEENDATLLVRIRQFPWTVFWFKRKNREKRLTASRFNQRKIVAPGAEPSGDDAC
jgi:hypothetical protein